ncbi:MAG: SIS domain-containing protein [Actinomycetota bacterium]|nr:SIS domain-containing protein [Actinomycetota bacterium]
MCGIVAVLRRPSRREPPDLGEAVGAVKRATGLLDRGESTDLVEVAELLESMVHLLGGVPGLLALERDRVLAERLSGLIDGLISQLPEVEVSLTGLTGGVEEANAALTRIRDASWSLARDRLAAHTGVVSLASVSEKPSDAGLAVLLSVQQALSAIDRLEVRGRDSAGLQIVIWNHGLEDLSVPGARTEDPLFQSGSVRHLPCGGLLFVVKAAAEIGDLGDNTAALRRALSEDRFLARALTGTDVQGSIMGHTRWASVGLVSEANAHPLCSDNVVIDNLPLVTAVQNGDVDNYADLVVAEDIAVPDGISTDAWVVPALCAHHLQAGYEPLEAFRRTVEVFEGSAAVATTIGEVPDRLFLAVRGSGQALYVGMAEDAYVVASEPYGVVELTDRYLRIDGEVPADSANRASTRGQLVELDGNKAGSIEGVDRRSYDGQSTQVADTDFAQAEITTRDIDRGDHPHYLIKEIGESPGSVRATLRGRLVDGVEGSLVQLGTETFSTELRADLAAGLIARVVVVGQGTAAVAGQAVAAAVKAELGDTGIAVEALPATELSGFGLLSDMSDTLVIAISQSGTTTDTNRTVELVRARGARVVAIVNRRNSDLIDRSDGVLYTSDGRDLEMSVASTKAFYAQTVAGVLLAAGLADAVGARGAIDRAGVLAALADLPSDMEAVLALRPHIRELAARHAPSRRYWAVVGSGDNRVAAEEIRIKLSELCYKSVASDATEDKKHIDLSSEPLILVCATGMVGSIADDVAKEVAIFRAHKAAPIVVTDEDTARFGEALDIVVVPRTHPRLAFLLATMVGHLFGYEAARAIDHQAQPLREARAAIERAAIERLLGTDENLGDELLAAVRDQMSSAASFFFDELRAGRLNGHLEASSAVRLAALLRYACSDLPLESYQVEFGRVGTPALILDDLAAALTLAVEELTRPIDAIKHQAKTVTVGISRSDETLLETRLIQQVLESGAPRDGLSYETLRVLADLDLAVAEVMGFTRYRLDGMNGSSPTVSIVDRGGISTSITSRIDREPALRGTKHQVAVSRQVLVTRGARDDRTILLVPEVKGGEAVGITLLHIGVHDHLDLDVLCRVLRGYHNRYDGILDAVCETEPSLRGDLLARQLVVDLLTEPVGVIADRLRLETGRRS